MALTIKRGFELKMSKFRITISFFFLHFRIGIFCILELAHLGLKHIHDFYEKIQENPQNHEILRDQQSLQFLCL